MSTEPIVLTPKIVSIFLCGRKASMIPAILRGYFSLSRVDKLVRI